MKKYRVEYSGEAEVDIAGIMEYILTEHNDMLSANKVTLTIVRTCDGLDTFPKRSPVRKITLGKELRFIRAGKYTIVYYVDETRRIVTIYAVMYSRRDILAALENRG